MIMKKIISKRKHALAVGFCAVTLLGITAYAVTTTPLAAGTIAFYAPLAGPADVRMSNTTMLPGETTGWHLHPGTVYVVVTKGTLTLESGCGEVNVYPAGAAFSEQETNVHRAVNYGADPLEFFATGIRPAGSPGRINFDGPRCGPPISIDQCKENEWMNFNFPRSFENLGDCVSYVETGK
jgi:quercetin dioxygenase-like cupin family protein